MTKTEQFIKSLGCPIRKGTERMFIAIKGRGEKYGWNNVRLSKLSHSKFGIGRTQANKIIKDFRAYGILGGAIQKKTHGKLSKPNIYTIPKMIIKFFKKINTIFKGIVDMNKKIVTKNDTITKEGIISFIKRFNISIPIIQEQDYNLEDGANTLIYTKEGGKERWYNAFDYIKEKVNISNIELANYYLRV